MAANTIVNVRCPAPVIGLIDQVCKLYGFSRADVLRTGAINYCQQLLVTDTLQRLNDTCHTVAEQCDNGKLDMKSLDDLDNLVDVLCKQMGIENM